MLKSLTPEALKARLMPDGKFRMDYYFLGVLGMIIAVILFKLPHLGLPYFWDEAWVYAPAITKMWENGPSLLPNAIDSEYSRGHPLVFHFLGGVWMKIFGNSTTSVHSFALAVSIGVLLALYRFGKQFFSPKVGLIAVIFFGMQRAFLAQSAMLLPEMMMALWTLLVMLTWFQKKRFGFAIFASLMLLTKESGVVLLGAIGLWTLFEQFVILKGKPFEREFLFRILWLVIPVVVMGLYFVIQRIMLGWFLYPAHIGLIDLSWNSIHPKMLLCFEFLFKDQGRWTLTAVFLVSIIVFSKPFTWTERVIVGGGILLIPFFMYFHPGLEMKLILTLVVCLIALVGWKVWEKVPVERSYSHQLSWFLLLFGLCYVGFTSVNFMSNRYLMLLMAPVFPFMIHWVGRTFDGPMKRWVFFGLMAVLAAVFWRQTSLKSDLKDVSLSYVDALETQLKVVAYVEANWDRNDYIYTNHLYDSLLKETHAGFMKGDKAFHRTQTTFWEETQWALISNNHPDTVTTNPKYLDRLELIDTYRQNWFETKVYQVKPLPAAEPEPVEPVESVE